MLNKILITSLVLLGGCAGTSGCACVANDTRCLQLPGASSPTRGLGKITAAGILDVNTTLGKSYQLSLYFVAEPDSPRWRQSLRIMDLNTLNPIALTPQVDEYEEGAWWVFQCHGPIRIRFQATYGDGAVSAIMFD